MLEKISFNHFFTETKNIITPELYRTINPEAMFFFKSHKTYLALQNSHDSIIVAMAIGTGLEFVHDLRNEAHNLGFPFVKFITSVENIKVKAIARYAKGIETGIIKDYYGVGKDGVCYTIDTNNPRFNK